MYSEEQYHRALEVYAETQSVARTMALLGYPARRQTLYNWINRKRKSPEERFAFCGCNTLEHPRHPPAEIKLEALHRCFELGETVQKVADELGYSTASIYNWRKTYIQKGASALMRPPKEKARGKLKEGQPASSKEIDELKAKIKDMELEIDILKETIAILKKDQDVNMNCLCDKEKTVIVDALNKKYPIPMLLDKLQMAKSSYYYQRRRKSFQARHEHDSMLITKVFNDSRQRYGYRRIKAVLDREGHILSEKVIRRIMRENGLAAVCIKTKKFRSYLGEISPAVPNLVKRDFHAGEPNRK